MPLLEGQRHLHPYEEPDTMTQRLPEYIAPISIQRPWRPDPSSSREEMWFDERRQVLYVDFQETCDTCLIVSTWTNGLATSRWNPVMQTWEPEEWDPGIPLPFNVRKPRFRSVLDAFVTDIPLDVRDAVAPFTWRHFVLLRMIRLCPQTIELVQSNPMLAWILADTIAVQEIPMTDAVKWVFRKRREILDFCMGIDSESVVRTLSKIRGGEYSQNVFVELRLLLKKPQLLDDLRHVKIYANKLYLIREYRHFAQWIFAVMHEDAWDAYGEGNSDADMIRLWRDTTYLGETLGVADPTKCMFECGSIDELRRLHDRWTLTLNNSHAAQRLAEFEDKFGSRSFPAPPHPGNRDIVPILTMEELLREGEEMHNCVASYAHRIMAGECFIYRVLKPERATLEIAAKGGSVTVLQMKLACNQEPSGYAQRRVADWIRVVRLGSRRNSETDGAVDTHGS